MIKVLRNLQIAKILYSHEFNNEVKHSLSKCLPVALWAIILFSAWQCDPKVNSENANGASAADIADVENLQVTIETRLGSMTVEFFPDLAPEHVKSFIKLVREGFYDGTTFHRVIPDFMIQGGDPLSKDASKRQLHGTGGPGYQINAEFSEKKHEAGILSAARSQDVNSAGSQFFIVVKAASHLDGQYTAFGRVVSGMDVLNKISLVERDSRDNPVEPIPMTMKVVDASAN